MKQLLLDIKPQALPSLTNFVVGKNAEGLHSLKNALEGSEHRFIYF